MRFITILFLLFFAKTAAQSEIKGLLVTEASQPIPRANIILLDAQDNIITFIFSNKDGSFLLNTDKFGDFYLQISCSGFVTKKIAVSFIKKGTVKDLKEIQLIPENINEIKEVVIKQNNAITKKKDTIEYDVKNFANGTEKNVEELLKKIPGITVQNDGRIKFGNKEVSIVMVENDDLFENGYQTLTQNMPSQPLDKIQVLKHYSKNKLLKDIENSESIAINLTLKEDAKNIWFGNVLLASTSFAEKMFQSKINLMNFSKRKKIYLLFNANTLGMNEMNGVEYLIHPSSDKNVENVGNNLQTISLLNLHQKNDQFDEKRTNFNNDKLVSINYIYNFKTDWKVKFVTIFNKMQNRNFINSFYKFNYDGLRFINIENKTWKQNKENVVGKLEISKDFKNSSNIQFYNKLSSLNEDNENEFLFNNQKNNQIGNNKLFASENKIVYTKKIDSSQAIVAVGKYIFQNRPYQFTDENDVFNYILNNPNAKKIEQTINSKLNFWGTKISYLKKYAEDHSLEIQVGHEFRKEELQSNLNVFDSENQEIIFDKTAYQNNIDYLQNSTFSQIKYQKKKEKWNYGFTILNQVISTNRSKKNGFYLVPNFTIAYQNKKTGNFNLSLDKRISTTSINDFYTNFIYDGNRTFKNSRVGFTIFPVYSIGFSYNLGEQLSQYLSFNFNTTKNQDYISNNIVINPNYSFIQSILVNNNNTISTNLELRKYLKFLKSRISVLGNYTLSDYENRINNQSLIKTKFSNFKTGFEIKSGWIKTLNFEAGYEWTFSKINSDYNSNNYLDQKSFFNLYFSINPQCKIESNLEYYKFGNTAQKTTQFLDIKLNYTVNKYKLNLFLQGNNLLNSNTIQRYSINNISESLYTQRLLPLHIMVGINENF